MGCVERRTMELIGKTSGEHGSIVWHDDGTFSLTVTGERVGLAKDLFGKPWSEHKKPVHEARFFPISKNRENVEKAGSLIKDEAPTIPVMSRPRKPGGGRPRKARK